MKDQVNPKRVRQHHWLVAGEITFAEKQPDDTFHNNTVKLNIVLFSMQNLIRVQEMGKAQQTLQMQFFQQLSPSKELLERIQVTNVVILSMMYCGHMSQEDFNAPPEGMKIQEKPMSELDKLLAKA